MVIINPLIALVIGLTSLLPTALPVFSLPETTATAGPPDPRFGAVETYDAPVAASEMGAGWTRIPFLWAEIQPNGTHEWFSPISDEALALEIAQGRQPVGLVITTPSWATDMGIGPGVPYGLHTGHNDPNNLWATFLRSLVTSYAGRINNWIIWNEPDVWDAGHPGYTWGGSVEDFLQLQRVAYMTIKESNPGSTVIFSGTSYWWDAAFGRDLYFRTYLDALVQDSSAPGNNYYCDAVALHVYFQPDFVYSITALYHQLMREHGFDKPVWIVETNAAPSLDPQMPAPGSQFTITLEEQAAYIIQAFAMGIAGGAGRISVFKLIDTPTDLVANPEPFGLVRANGSRRPAFDTYRIATNYMAGFLSGQLEQRSEVSIVTIPRSSGTTTVLWTRTPSPATIQVPARASSAILVDMQGSRRTVWASDGVYTIALPGAICTQGPPCIIGGPPYLVIEGNVDAAPPPAPSAAEENQQNARDGRDSQNEAPTNSSPEPALASKYSVSLRPIEIKGAKDVWQKRGLPGYQIELVTGPPAYLYRLTVVDDKLTDAQRSRKPLNLGPSDIAKAMSKGPLTTTMTTMYNRRALEAFTVRGLFDWVTQYYNDRSASPPCDTEVMVHLNGDWAFPKTIIEQWDDDCETEGEPVWMSVVAFATLTPTPTKIPTLTATVQPSATARPSTTPSPTATARPSYSPTPLASAAAPPAPSTSSWNISLWMIFLVGVVITGAFLIRRNIMT